MRWCNNLRAAAPQPQHRVVDDDRQLIVDERDAHSHSRGQTLLVPGLADDTEHLLRRLTAIVYVLDIYTQQLQY